MPIDILNLAVSPGNPIDKSYKFNKYHTERYAINNKKYKIYEKSKKNTEKYGPSQCNTLFF